MEKKNTRSMADHQINYMPKIRGSQMAQVQTVAHFFFFLQKLGSSGTDYFKCLLTSGYPLLI